MDTLRVCLGCGTGYPAALKACPQCDTASRGVVYSWHNDVARDITAFWVPDGFEDLEDIPAGVTLTGPGAPQPEGKRAPARSRR